MINFYHGTSPFVYSRFWREPTNKLYEKCKKICQIIEKAAIIRVRWRYIIGVIALLGLLVGIVLWAKESTTPNTPAENTRD